MDVVQVFVGNVGVDLGCGDVGVPQHRLYTAEVGAVLQKVGGKGVADNVRGYFARDARFDCVVFDNALDRARGKPPARTIAA